jgi:hypothetical protein
MSIVVPIDADVSGLTRKLGMATSTLGGFGRLAGYVAGAAALGGLIATVKVGVDEFMQAEKVTAQTNAVLKSTGSVANVTKRQIDQLGTSIMRKSGFDDEAVKSSENLLLTFTKVRNEAGKGNDVFTQATQITADLSVAFGKDLNSSAILVGKALNDPIKGLGALSRVGIQFTAGQKDQIKAMVESGNVMGAQKMILKELETQVGGSAAAYGKTLPGQLNILKETFNNLAGDLVATFMPTIARAAQGVVDFITHLQAQPTLIAKIKFVIGSIGDVAWSGITSVYTWWNQQGRVELPAHIILIPSGRQQFDTFFTNLESDAREAGHSAGLMMIGALVGIFTSEGRSRLAKSAQSISDSLGSAGLFWFRITGTTLIQGLVGGLLSAIPDAFSLVGPAIRDALTNALKDAIGALPGPLKSAAEDAYGKIFSPRSRLLHVPTVAKVITNDMKAAIQSARAGLAGAASGLGGMISQIIGANASKAGVYGNAAAQTAEGRALEDRRLSITEQGLKDALSATEDGSAAQAQAKLDLDQFYYDKSQTLRQRDVDDQSSSNQRAIDDLAARFNKGLDDAATFSSKLDALIGGEAGTSLGDAFSLGFTNAIQSLKNAANDIAGIAGVSNQLGPDVGATGGPVSSAALASYNDALSKWQTRQDALAQKVKDLRDKANNDTSPDGKTINENEQNAIDAAIKRRDAHRNDKPKKSDYGLATGGLLTGPRYLAGESGNEAVIPLGSPTAVQMMRKAFGESINSGGDTVYNISIAAGMGSDGTDIGRQIVEAIKVFERRNGPVFAGA